MFIAKIGLQETIKKVEPLSWDAFLVFLDLEDGKIDTKTIVNAKRCDQSEIEQYDWLSYVAGMNQDMIPADVLLSSTKDAVDLVIDWLKNNEKE